MTKFKVLEYNKTYMTHLGIYSDRLNEPTNVFFKSFGSYFNIFAMIVTFIGSVVFFKQYYSSDVKSALGAFKICFAAVQWGGTILDIGVKTTKVKELHLELQQIVDEEEDNIEVHNIYWECEQKCRKHTQRFSYFVIFHSSAFTMVFIYALISIAFGYYDTSSWYLSLFILLPLDRTTVVGWFITCIAMFYLAFSYAWCMTAFTSYFLSCCYYIHAMCNHFVVLINSIRSDAERMQMEKSPRKIKIKCQQINKQLCNMVKLQIRIYKVFYMLADISSGSIFGLIPPNILSLALSMYDVEMSSTHFEPKVLPFDISCIICAFSWPGFVCYSALHVTDRIASIGDMVYSSNWPEYPSELRKHIILIIARSQQPVYFSGLGLVDCTLEVFGKLCKAASSYYLGFRAIERR